MGECLRFTSQKNREVSFMSLFNVLLDFIFPRDCFYCKKPIDGSQKGFICDECFEKIIFNRGICCRCCGRALTTEAMQGENDEDVAETARSRNGNAHETPVAVTENVCCLNCTELQPFFDSGISLFAFTGVGRAFVHTLKYHNGTYLRGDLQRLFLHEKDRLRNLEGAVFVPVPLHFFRKWKRGYNQSDLIANALAKYVGGSVQRLLRRKRHTPSQTSLTKAQRKENVRGAFGLRRFAKIDPQAMYVLTDDVFTTGSTLNECARVLKESGATVVRVFTLAHG